MTGPMRLSSRAPSLDPSTCPACKDTFYATQYHQKYCGRQKCYQWGLKHNHDPDMPRRIKAKWETYTDPRPTGSVDKQLASLKRRRAANDARLAAQEALERELANWPAPPRDLAASLKTAQNWQCNYDLG